MLCSVLSLCTVGCTKYEIPDEHYPSLGCEFEGYVLDSSAYAADGGVGFTTTWVSDDDSMGAVIPSRGLYFNVTQEVYTEGRELHNIAMKVKDDTVVYFEVDGVVYLDFVNSSNLPISQWFNLEDVGKKVVEE